jgi:hypothetical protein
MDKLNKSLLIVAILVLTQGTCLAGEMGRYVVSIASKHSYQPEEDQSFFNPEKDRARYNEKNPGIGIEKPFGDRMYFAAGSYLNSHENMAVYAGLGKDFYSNENFALCGEGLFLFGSGGGAGVLLCARVSIKGHGIKLSYAPAEELGMDAPSVAILQYHVAFGRE